MLVTMLILALIGCGETAEPIEADCPRGQAYIALEAAGIPYVTISHPSSGYTTLVTDWLIVDDSLSVDCEDGDVISVVWLP